MDGWVGRWVGGYARWVGNEVRKRVTKFGRAKKLRKIVNSKCASLKKGGKDTIKVSYIFSLTKALAKGQPVQKKWGSGFCNLTVAKHQWPYAQKKNDRHWRPQTTGHVRLHIFWSDLQEYGFTNGKAGYQTIRKEFP